MSAKRPRTNDNDELLESAKQQSRRDDGAIYANLKAWLESAENAHVNPLVSFDETQRVLFVKDKVAAGTRICEIPSSCLLSVDTVRQRDATTWVDKVIDFGVKLQNNKSDCIVALYLATSPQHWQSYISSLPSSTTLDALPRRWSEQKVQDYLGGSPLCQRIESARQAIISDYKILEKLCKDTTTLQPFPSIKAFDDAMAIVSSRAFEGTNNTNGLQESTTLIPMLDLCNHHRGQSVRNISYSFTGNGNVVVTALNDILPNEPLKITYGAKGSHVLLLNYGFCIQNNFESDGSCNDFYELVIPNSENIRLTMGPKAYSYGGLVKAIESFMPVATETSANNTIAQQLEDDDDNGFDDFMNDDNDNGLDSVDGSDENDVDDIYNDCDDDENAADDNYTAGFDDTKHDYSIEITAIHQLRDTLTKLLASYSLNANNVLTIVRGGDNTMNEDAKVYSAILVLSEMQTLYFFIQVLTQILLQLDPSKKDYSTADDTNHYSSMFETEREKLTLTFIADVVSAYMKIRHPEIALK